MTADSTRETVLITGSSGLIGKRLSRELQHSYALIGLDVNPSDDASEVVHITTDLTDDASLEHALQEVGQERGKSLASVVHLAAYYDFSGESSPLYDELTVEGTRRLLRELQKQQFDVEQFVFSSSLLVMKPNEGEEPIAEHSPTECGPSRPFAKSTAKFPSSSCASPASMTKNATPCRFHNRSPASMRSRWRVTSIPAINRMARRSSISMT
jgi:nucleoside-diphosphate-sugar epimerase